MTNKRIVTKKQSTNLPLYMDYLFKGTIIKWIIDIFRDDKYCLFQIGFVFIIMFFYGINFGITILIRFARKYYILTIAFFIWTLRGFIIGLAPVYIVRTISFYFLIFGGYLFTSKVSEKKLETSLNRVFFFVILGALLGLIWYGTNNNPIRLLSENASYYVSVTDRFISIWLHPIPAACFICVGMIILNHLLKKTKGLYVVVCILSLILSKTRSAWLAMLIIFVVSLIEKVKTNDHIKLRRSTLKWYLVGLALGAFLLIAFSENVIDLIDLITERLFGQRIQADISYLWRINSIILMVGNVFRSNVSSILFGHGLFQGGRLISKTDLSHIFAYNIKTIDNNYVSLLYDFGTLGFMFMIEAIIITTRSTFQKNKPDSVKAVSYCLLFLLIMAFFFEELYWFNTAFVFFTFIGILLSLIEKENISKNSKKVEISHNEFIK